MLVDSVQPGDYYVSAVGVVGDFHFARHSHRMGEQVKRGRVWVRVHYHVQKERTKEIESTAITRVWYWKCFEIRLLVYERNIIFMLCGECSPLKWNMIRNRYSNFRNGYEIFYSIRCVRMATDTKVIRSFYGQTLFLSSSWCPCPCPSNSLLRFFVFAIINIFFVPSLSGRHTTHRRIIFRYYFYLFHQWNNRLQFNWYESVWWFQVSFGFGFSFVLVIDLP